MTTLYQYLHCPYCVRANMVANYTGVKHNKVFLLNDDDKTCNDLIGQKMVPVLQLDDGTAMGESLDIVEKLLSMAPPGKQLRNKEIADDVTAIFSEYSHDVNCLLFPRNVLISQPEFETASARDYFQAKKEKLIGMTFDEAMENSAHAISKVNTMLAKLPALTSKTQLSMDDVLIFPTLRNLTMVKNLEWPQQVKQYVEDIAKLTQSHLYWQQAI